MSVKHTGSPIGLIVIILLLLAIASFPAVGGTFKDRDGGIHVWSIESGHQLVWDNAPYIPFGIVFRPKSLLAGASNVEFEADKAAVTAMKNAGITDLLIKPGDGGLAAVSSKSLQRIVDLLESSSMNYGIEIYDSAYKPLTGYVINPVANRVDGIRKAGDVSYHLPDSANSIWVQCDAHSHAVDKTGRSLLAGGNISIKVALEDGEEKILLFFPEKSISQGDPDWGLPDLWTEFDRHRDTLLTLLRTVKFGKGLRYFTDPFSDKIGIHGDSNDLIPTSAAFRLEYAAWLSKKYDTPRDVGSAWALGNHELSSFSDAARLVPLWRNSRGVPFVFDDATGQGFPVEPEVSAIWSDYLEFRDKSVSKYMNAMADVIKRSVADVPVIYTSGGFDRIFESADETGYDGLVSPVLKSRTEAEQYIGREFSLAEGSSRPIWMMSVLGTSSGKFESKEEMYSEINGARSLGSKGFVFDLGDTPSDANASAWVKEYSELQSKDKYFANFKPRVIYYPQGVSNVKIKQFSDGIWWLPVLASSSDLYLGPNLSGYAIAKSGNQADVYIWSLKGRQAVHFNSTGTVTVIHPSGETSELKPKKKRVEIIIGEEPEVVRGIAVSQFIPVEVVEQALDDLTKAVAEASKVMGDSSIIAFQLARATDMYRKNQLATCLDMVRVAKVQLREMLSISNTTPGGLSNGAKSQMPGG